MSMSTNTIARERLEALVGEWALDAGPPGGPVWPGGGRVTFEWMKDAPLLIQRSHIDLPEAPDVLSVIGCDGRSDAYYQLYTDDRDVQRLYEMDLRDGVWSLSRQGEPFAQRFTGTFSEDGCTITGRWELAEDGKTWKTDFEITFTRISGSARAN